MMITNYTLNLTGPNNRGNTISRTNELGQKTTLERGPNNRVTSRINPLGRSLNFDYDSRGNVTKIAEPGLQETTIQYHPTFNKPTTLTNGLGHIRRAKYDTRGNQTESTNQLGFTSFVQHNALGSIIHIQFPEEQEPGTSFGYNSLGSLTSITNPLGHVSRRTFDAASRLSSISGPRGFPTRINYDGLNQVTRLTNPRGGVSTFGYDNNGNLATRTTANQKSYSHTYDDMDRLETTTDPLNRSFTFAYDRIGNVTGLTDRKNQPTDYGYDALNRPTSVTYADGSTVTPEYDRGGRLQRLVDSSAGTIEWVYDAFDRVIQEITPQGSVSYQYDAIGRRTQMTVNGQAPVSYEYDAANRLTRVEQGNLFAAMTYDKNDRRISLTYSNGTTTTYAYDHASQVTGITHTGPGGLIEQLTYAYDPDGNQTSVTRANGAGTVIPAAVSSTTYDAANQQTAFNGAALTYDAKGSLTNDGTNTYQWNARDQLVAISGAVTASFTYDGLGRRTSKTIDGHTTTYLYDGHDIVAEIDNQEGLVTYLRGLNIDEPFIRQTSAGEEYYHVDSQGSTLVLSDAGGTTTTSYTYDPFGQTTVTGTSSNALQYTSRENDGTGLYYYRARYYSPTLHRFISEDPIGLGGGDENFYAYTFNSPTNYTDPSGTIGLGGCLTGVVTDAILSGRKPTLASVAGSCALGAIGGQAAKHAFTAAKQLYKSLASKLASRAGKGADEFVDLTTPARRRHILDGDATGGGHRAGTGRPGKSEFPAGRSDDSIIHDISDIATDPTLKSIPGRGGRTITDGTRNGVDIRVIQGPNGEIITGFPTNTLRNPR